MISTIHDNFWELGSRNPPLFARLQTTVNNKGLNVYKIQEYEIQEGLRTRQVKSNQDKSIQVRTSRIRFGQVSLNKDRISQVGIGHVKL